LTLELGSMNESEAKISKVLRVHETESGLIMNWDRLWEQFRAGSIEYLILVAMKKFKLVCRRLIFPQMD
jgi:hypothetical protein